MNVRFDGDWESWIKFFLKGVIFTADEATASAKSILYLQQHYTNLIGKQERGKGKYIELFNKLFENPLITKKEVAAMLDVSAATAGSIVESFVELGILQDASPNKQRYKKYIFGEYFEILRRGTDL